MPPEAEGAILKLSTFGDALARLEEALTVSDPSSLEKDGGIQRFEFTMEAAWKVIRAFLLEEKLEIGTPKAAISGAFQAGWIQDEPLWLEMLKARNESSHLYKEARAAEIFSRLPEYAAEMRRLHKFLSAKSGATKE